MKNSNTSNSFLLISRIRVILPALFAFTMIIQAAKAQPLFTRTTFNAAYTPITTGGGATSATATGDNVNQTGIAIGFNFDYAGTTCTTLGLSTNGVVWFDATAPSATAG